MKLHYSRLIIVVFVAPVHADILQTKEELITTHRLDNFESCVGQSHVSVIITELIISIITTFNY